MTFVSKAAFAVAFAASALSTPSFAQTEAPGAISVSGGATLVSDYRFRGISLSNEKVAVQPFVTVNHESGLYAGVWGSTIADSPTYGKAEVDLYGGFATEIAPGTTADAGFIYYAYPDGQNAFGPSDYIEMVGKLSHQLGPVKATGTVNYAPDQNALGGNDNLYLNLGLSAGVPNTPVSISAGLGYTDGSLAGFAPDGNYVDWMVGASYVAGPATFSVQYVDTDIKKSGIKAVDTLFDPTVVFSLGVAF